MRRNSKKMRPSQRRRSFEGSRANPTGGMYSSRGSVTRSGYARAQTKPSNPNDVFFLDRYACTRAATYFPSLFLSRSAPDPGVLAGFERPLEAALLHRATSADGLSRLDLRERRASSAYGEEDLRIDVATSGCVPPVHRRHPHSSLRPRSWNIVKGFSRGTRTNIRRCFQLSKYLSREKNRYKTYSSRDSLTIRQIPPLQVSYTCAIHIRTLFSRSSGRAP